MENINTVDSGTVGVPLSTFFSLNSDKTQKITTSKVKEISDANEAKVVAENNKADVPVPNKEFINGRGIKDRTVDTAINDYLDEQRYIDNEDNEEVGEVPIAIRWFISIIVVGLIALTIYFIINKVISIRLIICVWYLFFHITEYCNNLIIYIKRKQASWDG